MTKSKKTKSLKKRTKGKTRKRVMHDKNYLRINNTGLTKVIYTEGNQSPKKTVFKWDGNYDGKNANIHMNLDVDGKKTHSNLKLSNNDLMKIIGTSVVDKPIDQRLELLDEDVTNILSPSMMILAEEPQMMLQPSSNVPAFINEMPEEQIMILSSPSHSSKKGKQKGSKSQRT